MLLSCGSHRLIYWPAEESPLLIPRKVVMRSIGPAVMEFLGATGAPCVIKARIEWNCECILWAERHHPPQIRTSQRTARPLLQGDRLKMCWHVLTVDHHNLLTVYLSKRGQRRKIIFWIWGLLPNTELSKYYVQDILNVHQAGDLAHGLGSIAQFLCAQNDILRFCSCLSAEHIWPGEP